MNRQDYQHGIGPGWARCDGCQQRIPPTGYRWTLRERARRYGELVKHYCEPCWSAGKTAATEQAS